MDNFCWQREGELSVMPLLDRVCVPSCQSHCLLISVSNWSNEMILCKSSCCNVLIVSCHVMLSHYFSWDPTYPRLVITLRPCRFLLFFLVPMPSKECDCLKSIPFLLFFNGRLIQKAIDSVLRLIIQHFWN